MNLDIKDILHVMQEITESFKQIKEYQEDERKEREDERKQREDERKQREAERKQRESERKQRESERQKREIQEALEKTQREAERKQEVAERKRQEAELQKQAAIKEAKEDAREARRAIAAAKWKKEMDQKFSQFTASYGREAEFAFIKAIDRAKGNLLGIEFIHLLPNIKRFKKSREYDIVLLNGDYVGLVEIKRTASKEDVLKLIGEQVEDFKVDFPNFVKDKKLICFLASYTCIDEVLDFATANGVCVLLQKGFMLTAKNSILKYF